MKMTQIKKSLSFIVCIVLIAAMALVTTGCNDSKNDNGNASFDTVSVYKDGVIGKGEKSFSLTVTDVDGGKTEFTVNTDKETVGEALTELNFISGDEGQFGLYIKTVNGMTYDYDKDGKYWAFYIDGEYAITGIDLTEINESSEYELKVE